MYPRARAAPAPKFSATYGSQSAASATTLIFIGSSPVQSTTPRVSSSSNRIGGAREAIRLGGNESRRFGVSGFAPRGGPGRGEKGRGARAPPARVRGEA